MQIYRPKIKNITLTAFLFIFLYNTVGYFFIFESLQTSIKNDIAQLILQDDDSKKSNSTVLQFHKKDIGKINWLDDKKELLHNGKRYDVLKIVDDLDSISIHCMNDTAEDKLVAFLEDHVNRQVSSTGQTATKKRFPAAIKLYFLNEHTYSVMLYGIPFHSFCLKILPYSAVYFETSSPPPRYT